MFLVKGKRYILFALLLLPVLLPAQVAGKTDRTEHIQYWEGAVLWGPSVFMGDIKYYRYVPAHDEWRFAYGITLGRRFSTLFGVRGMLLSGGLAGIQKTGNHRMTSRYKEMNLSGILYLDNVFGEKRFDRLIQPYLLAGMGLVFYNTDLYTVNPEKLLKNSGNKTEGILLIGLGIDFRMNRQWSVSVESANRGVNSDYLDLWSSGFPFDVYNVTTVSIKYRFGIRNRNVSGYFPTKVVKRRFSRGF